MDGVAHFGWGGKLYNGYDFAPSSKRGFLNVGVENIAQKGIFTRGVLIDLPRMYEVDSIDPGTLITLEHIEAWESLTGERVRSGDVLLLRFGRWSVAKKDEDFNPWKKLRDFMRLWERGSKNEASQQLPRMQLVTECRLMWRVSLTPCTS